MKICTQCNIAKDYSEYHKCSVLKSGLKSACKECANKNNSIRRKKDSVKEKERLYVENNKYKIKEYKKKYYNDNKEEILSNQKKYYSDNKVLINERNSIYAKRNKDVISEYQKEYYLNNKEALNDYKKNWFNEKYNTDYIFKLKQSIRSLIRTSIKKSGFKKNSKSVNILGCEIEQLKVHLESMFEEWMNWDNYGKYNGMPNSGWDIDHIIPISSAKTEEEILKLNHYTNLQPLCGYINRNIKKDKIYYEMD